MGTIADAEKRFAGFLGGFESEVVRVMQENRSEVEEYIREQLYSGLNGREKPLRPTYRNDPWFRSEEAGHWKGRAEQYIKWKRSITPPARSWLGYDERSADTPNLIITGEFYGSIHARPFAKGLKIGSEGTPMGADIERKYGNVIFKPGNKAVGHFVEYLLKPRLAEYCRKWGIG